MGNYTFFEMFENPRRGRLARSFAKNVQKLLDLKSSSEQIFSEYCRWVPLIILCCVSIIMCCASTILCCVLIIVFLFRKYCVVYGKVFVVFQELFVVFADMGHRSIKHMIFQEFCYRYDILYHVQ